MDTPNCPLFRHCPVQHCVHWRHCESAFDVLRQCLEVKPEPESRAGQTPEEVNIAASRFRALIEGEGHFRGRLDFVFLGKHLNKGLALILVLGWFMIGLLGLISIFLA